MKKRIYRWILLTVALVSLFSLFAPAALAAEQSVAGETVIDFYPDYEPEDSADAEAAAEKNPVIAAIESANQAVNSFAWGPIMLVLLVGTGIWFTIRSGFFQFAKFGHVLKNTVGKLFHKEKKETSEKGAITPFQALTTAMAGTVGTGNIAGVAGAIVLGGPGAVFWMWVSALFGMMTKFSEVVLSIRYREKDAKGEWVGGPMYYIKNGLGRKWKWLAVIFSLLGALAAFGIGNMTQVNTIAETFVNAADTITATTIAGTQTEMIIRIVIGVVIAAIAAVVIIGGVTRIGKVTEKLVPFMSVFYIVGALIIVFANIEKIGSVFATIFQAAFAPRAMIGGVGGFLFLNTIKRGVSRGVFSNEAGLGSAPIAHASSSELNPVKQGLYGIFEVFMDTIVICTLTALVVLMSGIVVPWGNENMAGAQVTVSAYGSVFGAEFASIFVAVAILCFALSTMLSWALYGQRCFGFLTGNRGIKIYQIIFILVIVAGATMNLKLVWDIADTLNGLMAIPNLIALLGLSGVVIRLLKEYRSELRMPKQE